MTIQNPEEVDVTARLASISLAATATTDKPPTPNDDKRKTTSSVCGPDGVVRGRLLDDEDRVWEHNAWDHVEWDPEQEANALAMIEKQRERKVSPDRREEVGRNAHSYWDRFYRQHEEKFFKDRNWLKVEFPELFQSQDKTPEEPFRILEVGCGVGNTIFPCLAHHRDSPGVHLYAFDFAETAVRLVQEHPQYDPSRCTAFVHDLASEAVPAELEEGTLDVIVLIFVLSALRPETFTRAIGKLVRWLRPGGVIVFRDYGRHDLTQLRFKGGRMLDEHFYMRGDGTQVYYFTLEQVEDLFTSAGLEVVQNEVDRRLLVNRKRKLKMYRIWIQSKFRKPLRSSESSRGIIDA